MVPADAMDGSRPDDGLARDAAVLPDAQQEIPRSDAGSSDDAAIEVDGSRPTTPVVPDGPVPNCRVADFSNPPKRSSHWLAYRAQPAWGEPFAAYLSEISDSGPSPAIYSTKVDPDWSVGTWSSTGSHFAHEISDSEGGRRGIQIVTINGSEALFHPLSSGYFQGFAPSRSSFVLAASSVLQVYNGEDLVAGSQNATRVYGAIDQYFWSPDGRYYGMVTTEAPEPGLRVLDLDAPTLALSAPFSSQGGYAKWSVDARYIAYVRAANGVPELWVVDARDAFVSPRRVGLRVNNVNSTLGNHTWLDSNRLLWEDIKRSVHVTTVSDGAAEDYVMFTASGGYVPSPGSACIAYQGACGPSGEEGVCVRELAQGGVPRLVSRQKNALLRWTDAGDRLMVNQYSGTIEALNTDGEPFDPLLVRDSAEVSYHNGASWWSPGYPSRWIAYTTGLKNPTGSGAFLWNVTTGHTTEIAIDADLTVEGMEWSRDGRFLAIQTRTPDFPPTRAPAVIQQVGETALGEQWEIRGPLMPLSGFTSNHFSFQP